MPEKNYQNHDIFTDHDRHEYMCLFIYFLLFSSYDYYVNVG